MPHDCLNLSEDTYDVLGALDELNSFIGFARCFSKKDEDTNLLASIQNCLFLIQAEIANPKNARVKPPRISKDHIQELARITHRMERDLPEINHFIIPQGDSFACALHYARSLARRAEREIAGFGRNKMLRAGMYENSPWGDSEFSHVIQLFSRYLDHVACAFFALARKINWERGAREQKPDYYRLLRDSNAKSEFKRGECSGKEKDE